VFGVWDLVLLWSLEFGIWSFLPELSASQELKCGLAFRAEKILIESGEINK